MGKIKVSIVMPMYNSIKYLEECMDSIIHQSLRDIEILIIDAGSTDGTLEFLEKYVKKDERITICHSEKKSMGYQYNLGIHIAQGEYIGFLESDDYVMSNMYGLLYDYANKNDVDWVKANYYFFMDYPKVGRQLMPICEKKKCGAYKIIDPSEYPMQYIQETYMWAGIYKRKFILDNKILLNETPGAAFQDTGFVLQAFMYATKAMYIDECLYCYRRDNQASSAHQSNSILYEIGEVKYLSRIIKQNDQLYNRFWGPHYLRAWNYFFAFYKKLPSYSECSAEVIDAINQYRLFLLEYQNNENDLFKNETYDILNAIEYYILKKGIEEFDAFYRDYINKKNKVTEEFVKFILQKKKIIVWGCGDNGLGLVSFLLRSASLQELYMCDNSEKYWNKTIMGIKVFPPNRLFVNPEFTVLIANKRHFSDINIQLLKLGYSKSQVWAAPELFRVRGTNIQNDGEILPCE